MDQTIKTIIVALLMAFLVSCAKQSSIVTNELDKQFSTAVPIADLNKSLQITVDSKEKIFESGTDISILIYNKSSDSIHFDNSSYIRLLVNPDNLHWLSIENEMTYFGTREVLPKGTPLLDFVHTDVKPLLNQSNIGSGKKNVVLRIVTVGEVMKNDKPTGQMVAAYTDVTLTR